jgi:hypothetical protein
MFGDVDGGLWRPLVFFWRLALQVTPVKSTCQALDENMDV